MAESLSLHIKADKSADREPVLDEHGNQVTEQVVVDGQPVFDESGGRVVRPLFKPWPVAGVTIQGDPPKQHSIRLERMMDAETRGWGRFDAGAGTFTILTEPPTVYEVEPPESGRFWSATLKED